MGVSRFRVSFTDAEGIPHAVEVQADSLYDAVALAAAEFRVSVRANTRLTDLIPSESDFGDACQLECQAVKPSLLCPGRFTAGLRSISSIRKRCDRNRSLEQRRKLSIPSYCGQMS